MTGLQSKTYILDCNWIRGVIDGEETQRVGRNIC